MYNLWLGIVRARAFRYRGLDREPLQAPRWCSRIQVSHLPVSVRLFLNEDKQMNKSLLMASLIAAMALAACGKKPDEVMPAAPEAASAPAVVAPAVEAASAAVDAASAAVDAAASAVAPAASN